MGDRLSTASNKEMPGHPEIHVDVLDKCTDPKVYQYEFFLPDKAWRKLPYLHTFLHKLQLILCTGTFILPNFKTAQRTGRTPYIQARADATFSRTAAPFKATLARLLLGKPMSKSQLTSWLKAMECLLQNLHNYQTTTRCVPKETLYVMQSATEED